MNITKRNTMRVLRTTVLLLFVVTCMSRCARMLTPTGGPVDSLPPVVVSALPSNMSTHMKERKIYIEFDEYIQLKDQQKEFFTSPQMKKKPQLSLRGKGLLIQIKDTLRDNTTYALNFGSAVRDNNEGNPLNSLRYVFSTGDAIDSIICSGYTADSYKADSVSKSFLYFFPADSVQEVVKYDSTLFKYKPAVIARAENNGVFIAQNLKPIPYRIYAIQDRNDNQMYDPAVDQVGFIEGPRNPLELPDFAMWYDSIRKCVTADPQLYFRMFTDITFRRQLLQDHTRPLQHKAMLFFGGAYPKIERLVFDSIPADKVIVEPITMSKDTLAVWFNMPSAQLPDTIKGQIIYLKHDSLNVLRPDTVRLKLPWRKIETKNQERERMKLEKARKKAEAAGEPWIEPKTPSLFAYKMSLTGEINPEQSLQINFDYPLVKMDSAAMLLTLTKEDKTISDLPVRFVRDTAGLHRWHIKAPWKAFGQYTLTIPSGALTDVAGFTNDSIVGKYTLMDPEKCATVTIKVTDKGNDWKYIIQLLDGNGAIQQERRDVVGGTCKFNYVPAGEIKFRLIEDRNGNGKWDSGSLVAMQEPERAEVYSDAEGKDVFATKANWEFEVTMDMNQIFAPVTMESLTKLLDAREAQRLQREIEQKLKDKKAGKKNKRDENNNNDSNMNNNMNSTGNMFNSGGAGGRRQQSVGL
ncbi:MAG: Ig-like domain-containing protein [Alistipes sp.]